MIKGIRSIGQKSPQLGNSFSSSVNRLFSSNMLSATELPKEATVEETAVQPQSMPKESVICENADDSVKQLGQKVPSIEGKSVMNNMAMGHRKQRRSKLQESSCSPYGEYGYRYKGVNNFKDRDFNFIRNLFPVPRDQ